MPLVKEAKSIVKVMKQEAKAEQKALEVSVKELSDIQRMQKNAIKVRRTACFTPLYHTAESCMS